MRRRFSLKGTTKKSAMPEALEIVTNFFRKSPNEITVREIWDRYLRSLAGRPAEKRMKTMTAMMDAFGDIRTTQIEHQFVKDYCEKKGQPEDQETC